jgi:hypothetical protein
MCVDMSDEEDKPAVTTASCTPTVMRTGAVFGNARGTGVLVGAVVDKAVEVMTVGEDGAVDEVAVLFPSATPIVEVRFGEEVDAVFAASLIEVLGEAVVGVGGLEVEIVVVVVGGAGMVESVTALGFSSRTVALER